MNDGGGGTDIQSGIVDITPDVMLPLFGRAGRTQNAHSVASRLEANCLLIRGADSGPAAFVTIDSLYPSAPLVDAVVKASAARGLTLDASALLIVASHTHNAPALDPSKPKLGAFDPTYLEFVADRISKCLVTLSKKTGGDIVGLAHGHSQCDASVYRRKAVWGFDLARLRLSRRVVMSPNQSKRIGKTLKMALFTDGNGALRAVLWTWPCHAVSEPDALAISADFPGAVRDHSRRCFSDPTLPVLFIPLQSGGARSGRVLKPSAETDPSPRTMQRDLTAAFDRASAGANTVFRLAGTELARTQRILNLEEIRDETGGLGPLTCNDWCLGPLRIRAVSAEIGSDYAATAGGDDPLSFPTGCAGQVFGYIPTDSQLPEGGYEVDGFTSGFSVPGRFRDAIEAKITGLIGG